MKYIAKNDEKGLFEEWVRETKPKLWNEIDKKENEYIKRDLKKRLEKNQGSICCYCGMRIDTKKPGDVRIEHVKSREDNKDFIFDFNNLLASCHGNGDTSHKGKGYTRQEWRRCDAKKGKRKLYKTPLDEDIEDKITCGEDGRVRVNPNLDSSEKEKIENDIESVLNLNSPILIEFRKKLIETHLPNEIRDDTDKVKEIIEEMNTLFEGKYDEYCFFIKKYAETLF